jgi:hypothetical protein
MRRPKNEMIRLAVHVRRDDASLVRGPVAALGDPARASETRTLLRERFGSEKTRGLKALLAGAPLEDVDLARVSDPGRDVEL